MLISLYDVEHGACALVSSATGRQALIDCGHNASTGWRPSTFLPAVGICAIDELFLTNYDEDHVSDLPNLRQSVSIPILNRNPTVTGHQLLALKTQDCAPGAGIAELIRMTSSYTSSVTIQPDWGDVSFTCFWNRYPFDFDDENNLSMAVFVRHPLLTVLFPGDLEVRGWKKLLENPTFANLLTRTHILVASHHGRRNGCCDELFTQTNWKPQIVIISDDSKQYDTQETVPWYSARCTGVLFDGRVRKVFTTRTDGAIYLSAGKDGCALDTQMRLSKLPQMTGTTRT